MEIMIQTGDIIKLQGREAEVVCLSSSKALQGRHGEVCQNNGHLQEEHRPVEGTSL